MFKNICFPQQTVITLNLNRFPHKNQELLHKWIEAVGRENWFPSKTAVLCGNHFCNNDFVLFPYSTENLQKHILKKDAVPSIFKSNKENGTEIDLDAVSYDSCLPLSSLSISHPETDESIAVNNCENMHDSSYACSQTSKLKELIKKKDKKIRRLQKKVLRQAKTIKGQMATLDQKKLISRELAEVLDSNFGHIDVEL